VRAEASVLLGNFHSDDPSFKSLCFTFMCLPLLLEKRKRKGTVTISLYAVLGKCNEKVNEDDVFIIL
jgi:hypothetical protein